MKEIKKPIQPFYLPQMNGINYKFIKDNLDDMNIAHELVILGISQVKPIQKEVDLSKIKSLTKVGDDDLNPVFVSRDLYICDGHHRVSSKKYLNDSKATIKAIRVDADQLDACCILRLIQDRWEQRMKV